MPVNMLPHLEPSGRMAELDLLTIKYRHGKRGTYINDKCRCESCLAANRQYLRDWRLMRAKYARKAGA